MAITISGENNNDRITAADGVIDTISGFNISGIITASSFTGDLTGDVTGNLTGNVTGNINNSTLLLQTGGTERLRIDADGRVLIGTTTEGHSNADDLTIATTDHTGITLRSATNRNGSVFFSDGTSGADEYRGWIQYTHTSDYLTFGTNADERLRITSGGEVGIGTVPASGTTLDIDASGGGVLALRRNSVNTNNKITLSHDGTDGTLESTNSVIFRAGGDERLRITSGGNLSLGTTVSNERVNIHTASSLKAQMQFTNTTTGTASGDGLVFGITGGEEAIIWNQENTSMKFATGNTQHVTLTSTGQLGIGTAFTPPADGKRLTVICDQVGDGIHIGNKENLYPAGSTGYSDIRFSFYDYLTGGYTAGGEAIIRARSRNAYTNSRTTDLMFMTASDDGDPSSGTATEKVRITSDGRMGIGKSSDIACALHVYHATNNEQGRFESGDAYSHIVIKDSGSHATAPPYFGVQSNDFRWITHNGTNSAERLRLTSGGSVLINTTVTTEASADGNDLIIGSTSNTHAGMSIVGSTSGGIGNIFFTDGAGYKNQGIIQYRHTDDTMRFTVGQYERLRIESDGNVRVSDQHLRFDTTGKGIIFGIDGGSNRPSIFGNYTSSSDNNMVFNVTGVERLRITSDGSLQYKTGGGKGYEFHSSGSSASVANMFCPASYTIAFGTNNLERLRIDSSGNVMIGSGSPSFASIGGNTEGGLEIHNLGNDTAACLKLTGNNNTGTPGQETYTQLEHRGGNLTFNINHNGTEAFNIGTTGNIYLKNCSTIPSFTTSYNVSAISLKGGGLMNYQEDNIYLLNNIHYDGAWRNTYAGAGGFITLGSGTMNHYYYADQGSASQSLSLIRSVSFYKNNSAGSSLNTGNRPSYQGSLIIWGHSSATTAGGIEFHTSGGGGAGYGSRITAASDGTLSFHVRNNNSAWTTPLQYKSNGDLSWGENPNTTLYDEGSNHGAYYRRQQGSFQFATKSSSGWSNVYLNKNTSGGTSDSRWVDFYWNSSSIGQITHSSGNVVYGGQSDYRLKENVVDITDGISRVKQLQPRRFNWISDPSKNTQDGFIAHEVQSVVPVAVTGTKDKVVTQEEVDAETQPEDKEVGTPIYQQMDYGKVTPLLTAAVKELIAKVETLEAEVAALKGS